MGKSKRALNGKKMAPQVVYGSDDERAYSKEVVPDPESADYFNDDVDTFHADREKILLDSGRSKMTLVETSSDEEEEVLGIDDDDEDIEIYEKQLHRFKSRGYHDDMGSDLEDGDKHDSDMPDEKAWGKKKLQFYGADVSDDEDIDFSGSEPDTALLEEQEALAIQRRMADQLADDDFGLDLFTEVKERRSRTSDKVDERITTDMSKLSKRETLQLVKKESPELLELIQDFTSKMADVRDRLMPVLQLIKSGSLQTTSGHDYILTKLHLYLNYCVNVNFYVMLKAKRVAVQAHPVIKRIVQYRNLIKELRNVKNAEAEIDAILVRWRKGERLQPVMRGNTTKKRQAVRQVKSLSEVTGVSSEDEEGPSPASMVQKKARKKDRYETSDEKAALEYYEMLKGGRHKAVAKDNENDQQESGMREVRDGDTENVKLGSGEDEEEEQEEQEEAGKRGITYQIAKNKGMTPRRKKEERNPRVKNRMKYQKAKMRRKGKVRTVVTEMHRYGGESSGIRAGIKKSIKFK